MATESHPPLARRLLFTLLAGLAGFLLNSFPIRIAPGPTMILGGFFSFCVALSYGWGLGWISGLLAGTRTYFLWHHPLVAIVYGVEAAWVGWLGRRRMSPFFADLFFWIVIGWPAMAAGRTYYLREPWSVAELILLKLPLNSLFLVALADLALRFTPLQRLLLPDPEPAAPAMRLDLQRSFTAIVALPLFVMAVICVSIIGRRTENEALQFLDQSAGVIRSRIDDYTQKDLQSIQSLAFALEQNRDPLGPSAARSLEFFHQNYPEFLTMLVASRDGRLVAAHPPVRADGLAVITITPSVADREYFQKTMSTGRPFVSDTFLGRGFGSDPIIAVAAPLHDARGELLGIVEGSLNLKRFAGFSEPAEAFPEAAVVILDDQHRVIYASPLTSFKPLQFLDVSSWLAASSASPRASTRNFPLLSVKGRAEPYLLRHNRTQLAGWLVFVLQPYTVLEHQMRRVLLLALALFVGGTFLSCLVAQVTAARATNPIARLAARTREIIPAGADVLVSADSMTPAEITELVNNFETMASRLDKVLTGLLPICAACKKIRDDKGEWQHLEVYIRDRSEAQFTHSICPECRRRLYG